MKEKEIKLLSQYVRKLEEEARVRDGQRERLLTDASVARSKFKQTESEQQQLLGWCFHSNFSILSVHYPYIYTIYSLHLIAIGNWSISHIRPSIFIPVFVHIIHKLHAFENLISTYYTYNM